jgi:predicted YcjX-like family ATPase
MANVIAPYKDPIIVKRLVQFLTIEINTEDYAKKYDDSLTDIYSKYLQWVLTSTAQTELRQTLNFQQFSKTIRIAEITSNITIKGVNHE